MSYSSWIEFEHYADCSPDDVDNNFCNIAVTYDDGRHEGYNIWTAAFFRDNLQSVFDEIAEKGYATLPDIIVSRLERKHIEEVLEEIIGPSS